MVSSVVFSEDNLQIDRGGIFGKKYEENQTYVLKPGDNVSLSFTTSESVDEPSIQLKIGGEAIDHSSFSVQPDPIISTDGRHWKATYQISQQDNGTLEWMISGIDRSIPLIIHSSVPLSCWLIW